MAESLGLWFVKSAEANKQDTAFHFRQALMTALEMIDIKDVHVAEHRQFTWNSSQVFQNDSLPKFFQRLPCAEGASAFEEA